MTAPVASRRRETFRLIGWVVALAVACVVLVVSGRGTLAPPDLGHPSSWSDWLADRSAAEAAFSLLRLVALVAAAYLLATTAIGAVLRMLHAGRLVTLADRLTVAPVRGLLTGALGMGMLAAAVSGGAAAAAAPPSPRPAAVAPAPAEQMRLLPSDGPSTVTMRELDDAPAATPPATAWTVRPGQSFWSIAEDVLTQAWGHKPTDAELLPYWHTLIETNRHLLADKANPDLVFPGQQFELPPAPPPPPPA